MPTAPWFVHQQYRHAVPTSPHHLLASRPPASDLAVDQDRWAEVARAYRSAGVSAIYLVHGGLAANDAIDLLQALSRTFPSAAAALRPMTGELSQSAVPDAGSYTGTFAREFERAPNHAGGRADAGPVVRVVAREQSPGPFRCRGAAGGAMWPLPNWIAAAGFWSGRTATPETCWRLVTHLLARDREAADAFFAAAEVYYRWPLLGWIDIPLWHGCGRCWTNARPRLANVSLDVVTFGTPVLYGWNHAGYRRLLHFVYHRPVAGLPVYQAPFPPEPDRVLRAADGDYVQQLGIAGTDVPPSLFAWRARLADKRLGRVLQAGLSETPAVERLCPASAWPKAARRCWSITVLRPARWETIAAAMPSMHGPSGCCSMPRKRRDASIQRRSRRRRRNLPGGRDVRRMRRAAE